MEPDIRYARNGDVAIAYQVVGTGERDLVLVPDFMSNLVYALGVRLLARVLRTAGALVPRDPLRQAGNRPVRPRRRSFPALETRIDDMRAVLDAVGLRPRGRVRLARGRRNGRPLRGHVPRADRRARPLPVHRRTARPEHDPAAAGPAGSAACDVGHAAVRRTSCSPSICPTLLRSEADRLWFANWLPGRSQPRGRRTQLNKAYCRERSARGSPCDQGADARSRSRRAGGSRSLARRPD